MTLLVLQLLVFSCLSAPARPQDDGAAGDESERGLILRDERALEGYTLISPLRSDKIHLLDMDGEIVHSWSFEPCFRWGNALLSPSGELLVMGRTPHEQNPAAARESRPPTP